MIEANVDLSTTAVDLTRSDLEVTLERPLLSVTVEGGVPGPQGPPGPPGPPGTGGDGGPGQDFYGVFNQATPSDTWVLVHNQNTYGIDVDTVDQNDVPILGTVHHTNPNTIVVYFYYPVAGEARVYT